MRTETETTHKRMPQHLIDHLQRPQLVLITTLDAETGRPANNLITWVLARDATSLRLVAEANGRVLENIRHNEDLLLTVLANNGCYAIEGQGRVIADELQTTALKLGMAEVDVEAVRDVIFYGGKLTAPPQYTVTYDQATKETLDEQVFTTMRNP